MTPSDLAKVAAMHGVSRSVARLSCDQADILASKPAATVLSDGKRLRQDTKPLCNKLELAFLAVLRVEYPGVVFRAQARRFRLASGAWYRPDITALMDGKEVAWECKGPKQMKNIARGMLTLKFAAEAWPEVEWWLVWRETGAGAWKRQQIVSQKCP